MKKQELEVGTRVRFEGEPFPEGTVEMFSPSGGDSVLVCWDNGSRTWEWVHDLANISRCITLPTAMPIEMERDGKFEQIEPKDLTTGELLELLSRITLDSDEFLSKRDIEDGYAAIKEAMRRLREQGERER